MCLMTILLHVLHNPSDLYVASIMVLKFYSCIHKFLTYPYTSPLYILFSHSQHLLLSLHLILIFFIFPHDHTPHPSTFSSIAASILILLISAPALTFHSCTHFIFSLVLVKWLASLNCESTDLGLNSTLAWTVSAQLSIRLFQVN